jgi:hypothetical protein
MELLDCVMNYNFICCFHYKLGKHILLFSVFSGKNHMNFCIYEVGHDTSHTSSKPVIVANLMNEYKIRDDIKVSLNVNLRLFYANLRRNM